jgi:calcineurin-like phosphoesterase family protein
MKDPLLLPDVIFFTGDITQKSREDEYNNAWNFFFKPLLEKLSLSENQLFFIPGNHDVDRTKTTNLDSGIVQRITDSTDVYSLLNDSNKSGYLDQLIQRMTEYQKFQNKITKHKFHIEKLSWGNLFTTKDKVKIGIIGLNSSWTSASIKGYDGDVEEQGKLIVGKPLVEDAIEQVKKISSNYDLLITLIHHPIDWLMPWDQKDVRQIIRDNSTFLLHGHVHETNISFLGSPNPTTMVISAGTISKKLELQEINSCLHSYNIVRLDITNSEGKIYFRRFDPVSQRYGNDDTSFINAKDGIYSFNYKEDFNK